MEAWKDHVTGILITLIIVLFLLSLAIIIQPCTQITECRNMPEPEARIICIKALKLN